MTDLPGRLADILAQHDATLHAIEQPEPVAGGRDRRVLLLADQQRGPIPVRIGQPGNSARSSST